MASKNGHVNVVDKLLQHGARVDLQIRVSFTFNLLIILYNMKQNGCSSLMYASLNGHYKVVDNLLHHGARVNLSAKVGRNVTYLLWHVILYNSTCCIVVTRTLFLSMLM